MAEKSGSRTLKALMYEHMLMSRHALQGSAPRLRPETLERSAAVLLARLQASGPMSVGELAEAFDLDVSTVHRQVAAAMKSGLIERVEDPDGGSARKHRPSPEGANRLREDFRGRTDSVAAVTAEWADEDVEQLTRLMRRFNESVEAIRAQPWPRPDPE
ncbi:winged helix-turn-helix transcriptional regulator [Kocuria palustris]|jgi:DNA-binding MarR family transcriptional regulator|uniref:MarR family winged helix-turn-helix transcriptional regulator n=1 Tax=Kocuria palustris TaxID=71999 RepID=UPI00045EA30B|nr:MarR family winged helix-turn-helix transcriptional regulator [Kocuria palustris]MDN5573922.1 MarR family winged helix-turn-helix transcriptional regulator [Micrococcales bacterium]ALB02742.1 MarR family transcriptional regulator [Kocuria palustris]MBM7823691.1 DNA-binding MarR family transcriptional regulator [Kocuria palustris]MBN6751960.1 winged helix-turn-helix transcriptional regulator [Kocuria palustris]MBN6756915.1 winged helix-turn-helix transcriptional regulator [Kocuria palustris]